MNETQLIRQQLALERSHLAAVARLCSAAPAGGSDERGADTTALRTACVAYLACVLGWYRARDERLAQLATALDTADPRRDTLHGLLARSGTAGEALDRLAAAPGAPHGWQGFEEFLRGPWSARRDALERLLGADSRSADWRLIGRIDADGILEERARFAQVTALLPAGTTLATPPRAA